MCESSAYIIDNKTEILFMKDVEEIVQERDGRVSLRDLFGQTKTLHGRIKKIDFSNHKILIEKTR